jgi:N6-L-threonylcarbamoyladenine synthase
MLVLGIDTSCDDTSAAVLSDGEEVLSSAVHSQVKLHHPYGGVVPELASREHLRNMIPVVRESLARASITLRDLDAVAVTVGPGLIGSLLVGLYYAKGLALVLGIPLVGVNHLEGHILSILLEERRPVFPFVVLTVSGGHTSLYHVRGLGDYTLMGETLDDAAGEAFDKVAKVLGLGYPGGSVIEKMATRGRKDAVSFPRAYLSGDSLDFSFSGVKTAVALYVKRWREEGCADHSDIRMEDIAASFQDAVVEVLVEKLLAAQAATAVRSVVVAGGVACNQRLREALMVRASQCGIEGYFPRPAYCTDNGAMIALAGYHRLKHGECAELSLDVRSKFPIRDLAPLTRREGRPEEASTGGFPPNQNASSPRAGEKR